MNKHVNNMGSGVLLTRELALAIALAAAAAASQIRLNSSVTTFPKLQYLGSLLVLKYELYSSHYTTTGWVSCTHPVRQLLAEYTGIK